MLRLVRLYLSWLPLGISLTVLLASCGGSPVSGKPAVAVRGTAEFNLAVDLPASRLDGGTASSFALAQTAEAGLVELTVTADAARGLKAAYFTVGYDAAKYIPVSATALAGLGQPDEILELLILSDPGAIHVGQVLRNWDQREGASGDLPLAQLTFRPLQPGETAPLAKAVRAAPSGDASAVHISIAGLLDVEWLYANQGDYNQDGLVGIADLTPLGLHFNETGPFLIDGAQAMVDGNSDGEINVSDITPIGLNFNAEVLGGYNLYMSSSLGDYPAENTAPSSIPADANVPFAAATGTRATDRLSFSTPLTPTSATFITWVRPVDSEGNEGTPSNYIALDAAGPAVLSLVTAAIGGAGTFADPYVVDPLLDYVIEVNHPTQGDVTSDVATEYIVQSIIEGPAPGQIDAAASELQIEDGFTGLFLLEAKYFGNPADPLLFFRVPDPGNSPPTAFFVADPTSGVAPLTVGIDASGSNDSDGEILLYEFDFESDGTWDAQRTLYSGSTTEANYPNGGEMTITVRVTDDDGATDSTSFPVDVEGWQRILIETRTDVGRDPALAMIGGRPAIAYGDSGGNINYVRAADSSGSEWGSVIQLSNRFVASQICLAEVGGTPAIAYKRDFAGEYGIYYARSGNVDGSAWNTTRLSNSENDHSPTLALIDGNPAVAYVWDGGAPPYQYHIAYIRSADSTGTGPGAWDAFPSYPFSANLLHMSRHALYEIQSNPGIMFVSDDDELGQFWKLRQIVADNAFGSSWGFAAPIGPADGSPIDFYAATTIVGRPNLVVRNTVPGRVSFRRADNLDGTGFGSFFYVGDCLEDNTRGFHLDMANIGGFPAIIHYDNAAGELRYKRNDSGPANDGDWYGGSVVAQVGAWDPEETFSGYASLASLAGQPMIAYYDANDRQLYFSTFYDAP